MYRPSGLWSSWGRLPWIIHCWLTVRICSFIFCRGSWVRTLPASIIYIMWQILRIDFHYDYIWAFLVHFKYNKGIAKSISEVFHWIMLVFLLWVTLVRKSIAKGNYVVAKEIHGLLLRHWDFFHVSVFMSRIGYGEIWKCLSCFSLDSEYINTWNYPYKVSTLAKARLMIYLMNIIVDFIVFFIEFYSRFMDHRANWTRLSQVFKYYLTIFVNFPWK